MHPFQFMTDDQLIAGLNDFAERAQSGEVDDTEIESIVTFVDNKAQNMQRLMQTGADIREKGVCQADLARLEEISPGVTAGLNSGDYTFLASQHGLEPALNAIDWKAVGKWGIIGAIIAAIIALIAKIMGRSKGAKPVGEEFSDNYRSTRKEHDDRMSAIREKQRKEDDEYEERRKEREKNEKSQTTQKPKSGSVDIDLDSYHTKEDRENEKKQELKKGIEASNYGNIIKLNHARLNGICVTKPTVADYLKLPLSDILSKDKDISDNGLAAIYSFCYINTLHENQQAQISNFILRMTNSKSAKEIQDAIDTDRKFMGFLSTYQKRIIDLYEELVKYGTDDDPAYETRAKYENKAGALLSEYETMKKALGIGIIARSPSISEGNDLVNDAGDVDTSSFIRKVTMAYASNELDYAWENYAGALKAFQETINSSTFQASTNIIANVVVFLQDVGKISKEVDAEMKVLKRLSDKLADCVSERKKRHQEAKEKTAQVKRSQISTDEEGMQADHVKLVQTEKIEIKAGQMHNISYFCSMDCGRLEAQMLSITRVLMAMSKGGSSIISSAEAGRHVHNTLTLRVEDMLKVLVSIR